MITGPVKLVIWDLDDTFWAGTLSEEAVVPIARNIALVKLLAARGIISSICSKNDALAVEAQLRAMAVWDDFVLPAIAFRPKGPAIADLIAALQLRADNVLFIDDNPAVLAEAAFHSPGLQCLGHPDELERALDTPHLAGRHDPERTRLRQYHTLADRLSRREAEGASDEAFLRQSQIGIAIDYAVEPHLDRVVELINRANQLNFTKLRIADPADRAILVEQLGQFGYKAGVVRAWDRYGDYGIVGFFLTLATLREYRLVHFVFSCRIMNMGIEQFVYEYLNRPLLTVVPPVATGVDARPAVDWIALGTAGAAVERLRKSRLVLIGGCDMLQLSTYCSGQSVEFTNRDVAGIIKRLDDPFLILDDPEAVRASTLRAHVPAFDAADMIELRDAVAAADAMVVSLYRMMEINYFRGRDGLTVRFDEDAVKQILASDQALWFVRNFAFRELSHEQRQELIRRSLDHLAAMVRPGAKVIVILENTRKLASADEKMLRELYNALVVEQARANNRIVTIDINTATDVAWLFDDGFHMSRQGYHELAQAVNALIAQ